MQHRRLISTLESNRLRTERNRQNETAKLRHAPPRFADGKKGWGMHCPIVHGEIDSSRYQRCRCGRRLAATSRGTGRGGAEWRVRWRWRRRPSAVDLAGNGEKGGGGKMWRRRGPGTTDLDRALPPRGAPCLSTGRPGAHPAPVAIAAAEGPSAGGSHSAAGRAGGGENR